MNCGYGLWDSALELCYEHELPPSETPKAVSLTAAPTSMLLEGSDFAMASTVIFIDSLWLLLLVAAGFKLSSSKPSWGKKIKHAGRNYSEHVSKFCM